MILELRLPTHPYVPGQINYLIPARSVKFSFKITPREENSLVVCISWTIPIGLNTHKWHTRVHHLMMSNYFSYVQHDNPPPQYYLQASCSWLSPIRFVFRLFGLTHGLCLGAYAQVHFPFMSFACSILGATLRTTCDSALFPQIESVLYIDSIPSFRF